MVVTTDSRVEAAAEVLARLTRLSMEERLTLPVFREVREAGAAAQEAVNAAAAGWQRHAVIRLAGVTHFPYRQYAGHWDGPEWHVVRFVRQVRTKGGVAFRVGDVTLARGGREDRGLETAYSLRNGVDTSVPVNSFRVVTL
jgi:hypothetical protein